MINKLHDALRNDMRQENWKFGKKLFQILHFFMNIANNSFAYSFVLENSVFLNFFKHNVLFPI
jgi:hypothetical protein